MHKRLILVFVLLIPIVIVLILNIFGENEYKLDEFGDFTCIDTKDRVQLVFLEGYDQFDRFEEYIQLAIRDYQEDVDTTYARDVATGDSCLPQQITEPIILVDKNNMVRGQYNLSELPEADRLHTEIDILLIYE